MRIRAAELVVAGALMCLSLVGMGQQRAAAGKAFMSQAGWSVLYPASWKPGCDSCSDVTAADAVVAFKPARDAESDGWVKMSRLQDKPVDVTVDAWFVRIKSLGNFSPRMSERRLMVNGLPALKVRYREHEVGTETDTVYVLSGARTFSIEFTGEKAGLGLDQLPDYASYMKMIQSFKVQGN